MRIRVLFVPKETGFALGCSSIFILEEADPGMHQVWDIAKDTQVLPLLLNTEVRQCSSISLVGSQEYVTDEDGTSLTPVSVS